MIDKNTLKLFLAALLGVIFAFGLCLPTFAYSVPDESYYSVVDTSEIGRVKIYYPYNMGKYFTTSDSGIISTYSSTVSCWGTTDTGSTQYDIRFSFSSKPQYRVNNLNYSDLTITNIVESNLPLLNDTDFTLISQGNIVNMIMVFIGGSLLLFTIFKKG